MLMMMAMKKRPKLLENIVQETCARRWSTDSDDLIGGGGDEDDFDDEEILDRDEFSEALDPTKFLEVHVHSGQINFVSIEMPFLNARFYFCFVLQVSFREEESDEHRRKYKCPHCIKKFCWSTDLKRHILTHTGERPFSCEFCPANFTRKFLMQKHTRKHHPDKQMSQGKAAVLPLLSSVKNGHKSHVMATVVKTENETDEHIDQDIADSPQGSSSTPEESEQQLIKIENHGDHDDEEEEGENNDRKQPIVINVFSSSVHENADDIDEDDDDEEDDDEYEDIHNNIISLEAGGATISTTTKKIIRNPPPSLLTLRKGRDVVGPSSNNRNKISATATIVNS